MAHCLLLFIYQFHIIVLIFRWNRLLHVVFIEAVPRRFAMGRCMIVSSNKIQIEEIAFKEWIQTGCCWRFPCMFCRVLSMLLEGFVWRFEYTSREWGWVWFLAIYDEFHDLEDNKIYLIWLSSNEMRILQLFFLPILVVLPLAVLARVEMYESRIEANWGYIQGGRVIIKHRSVLTYTLPETTDKQTDVHTSWNHIPFKDGLLC